MKTQDEYLNAKNIYKRIGFDKTGLHTFSFRLGVFMGLLTALIIAFSFNVL